MQLWLIRHGKAVDPDEAATDFDRQLSRSGRKQIAHLGRWLKGRAETPDLILHSPLCRTTETAEILHEEFGKHVKREVSPLMAPGMRCEPLLAHVAGRTEQIVVCVGHQPDVSRCLAEMLGGGRFGFSPGTMAGVEFHHVVTPGGGELQWLLPPEWFP